MSHNLLKELLALNSTRRLVAALLLSWGALLGANSQLFADEAPAKEVASREERRSGANLPAPRSNTLDLVYGDRKLLIRPDESPLAAGSSETYFLEPPLFLVSGDSGSAELPKWILRVRQAEDGTVRFLVKVLMQDQVLLDAAETLIRVRDLDHLKVRSQQRNGGKPMQVIVQPMPLHRIRVEFVDRSNESEVLAFGEVDVSRTPRERELWIHVEPATLQKLLKLEREGLLGMKPWYSFPNIAMSRAAVVNFGESELRDQLNVYLKSMNLTGNGDVTQQDVDKFMRNARVSIWSRITADDPQAAGFLVNNMTQMSAQLFEPAERVPFETFGSDADRQKLSESLGALGWTRSAQDTYESVDERTQSQGKSSGFAAGLSAKIGNGKVGVGGQFGFSSASEQVEATLKRTGIVMQRANSQQGWMPAFVQKYRLKAASVGSQISYAAEVSIGLGPVNGLFNGEPFPIEVFSSEGLGVWAKEFIAGMQKIDRDRHPIQRGFEAAQEATSAIGQLAEHGKSLQKISEKVEDLMATVDTLSEKLNAAARLEGKIQGAKASPGMLKRKHGGIDEEEAGDMLARSQGKVAEMVGPLEKQVGDANAEVRTQQNAVTKLERELQELIDEHEKSTQAYEAMIDSEDAASLGARVREAYPKKRSFSQEQLISRIEELLKKRNELRAGLAGVVSTWKELEGSMLDSKAETTGSIRRAADRAMSLKGLQTEVSRREGKKEGMSELGAWYVGETGARHDAGEAKDIENWWNGGPMNDAQREIDAAKEDLRKKDPAGISKEYQALRRLAAGQITELRKARSNLRDKAASLAKVDTELDQLVARLLTSVTAAP